MSSLKKQINISTNLSNVDISVYNNYGLTYANSIFCKYVNSNNDKLINTPFTQNVDNVYLNNYYTSVSDLINYQSKTAFTVIYNISKELKKLDDNIFSSCPTLYSVSNISDKIQTIGKYAFDGCVSLRYLTLPSSITEIEEFAFNGTKNLKELNVENVRSIHNYTFAGCGIETINLNERINTLPSYLFKDCLNLKQFIGNSITKLGIGVFSGCTNLEYVELSEFNEIEINEEYIEEPENLIKEEKEVGDVYKLTVCDVNNEAFEYGTIKIKTIVNDCEEQPYDEYLKAIVIEDNVDGVDFSQLVMYIDPEVLNTDNGFMVFEDGNNIHIYDSYKFKVYKETEPEIIPVTQWKLEDKNSISIGFIEEALANRIKNYRKDGNPICEATDLGTGLEIISFLNNVNFIEYYIDGITPTGKVLNSPIRFQDIDSQQGINKYVYYSKDEMNQDIILDNNDINKNIQFNEDFTECRIKLNCYPIYEGNGEYVAYYMFEPFFSIRKELDENLVPKQDTNNCAFIDYGCIATPEGKYPVYNKNFCYIGVITNGQFLDYTTEQELDQYASRIGPNTILDNDGFIIGYYFTFPESYNYTAYDIETQEGIENVTIAITKIINDIIAYKNGTYIPEESEEEIPTYTSYSLNDLTYFEDKYELPDYLFASCKSLSNNNIIRCGNYDYTTSRVIMTFTKTKDTNNLFIGNWQDIVTFKKYSPSTVCYNYEFKWKIVNNLSEQCILIILNDNTYYITEKFENNKYNRYFKTSLYDDTNTELLNSNSLDSNVSIFDINLSTINTNLVKYQTSIYDKYELLDTIDKIGNATFMNCCSIENIYNKFETIGNFAFKDCINMKSIDLRNTKNIGHYAFQNCSSLIELYLNKFGDNKSEGIFYGCTSLKDLYNINLTKINNYTFKNCQSLENINLNNILSIGKEAFFNCKSLVIDNSNNLRRTTKIGDHAFYGCQNLKTLIFNEGLESIGDGAFKYCTKLIDVNLPATIKNFSKEMFYGCYNLETINFNSPIVGEIELSGLDYCNNIKSIHIPEGGRYITPNDNCIFDTQTETLLYVCKNISLFEINPNRFETNNINIDDNAFNNCQASIIKINKNINIPNLNENTFKNIKNHSYHILIEKTDSKYPTLYELVGRRHIYYV